MTYAENPDIARQLPRGRMKVRTHTCSVHVYFTQSVHV